jgi:hypothetical protein
LGLDNLNQSIFKNKKTMKRYLLFFLIFIISTSLSKAQEGLAQMKMEDAISSFEKGKYEATISKINEVHALINKFSPKTMHLLILAQFELLKPDPMKSFVQIAELKNNTNYYLINYQTSIDDRYRKVYEISEAIKKLPNTIEEYNEYIRKKELDKEKKREEEERKKEKIKQIQIEDLAFALKENTADALYQFIKKHPNYEGVKEIEIKGNYLELGELKQELIKKRVRNLLWCAPLIMMGTAYSVKAARMSEAEFEVDPIAEIQLATGILGGTVGLIGISSIFPNMEQSKRMNELKNKLRAIENNNLSNGEKKEKNNPNHENLLYESVFEKADSYIRIGNSNPIGHFGNVPNTKINTFRQMYDGNAGLGATNGFMLEFGAINYFKNQHKYKRLKTGLDYSFSTSYNKQWLSRMGTGWRGANFKPFFFLDFKIGPTMTFKISENLLFDAYYKLAPTISYGGHFYYENKPFVNDYINIKGEFGYGIKNSFGLNLKYKRLILGLEYNLGRLYYNVTEEINLFSSSPELFGLNDNFYSNSYYTAKAPTSTSRLSIGICF